MAWWVKNPTGVVQVTEKEWVQSPAQCSGLKDPALPELWLGFDPWPENFHMLWVWPQLKKKKKKKEILSHDMTWMNFEVIMLSEISQSQKTNML